MMYRPSAGGWKTILHHDLQSIKTFRLLNYVSIVRLVVRFPQACWSRPAATAADSERPSGCVCACPCDQLCQSEAY